MEMGVFRVSTTRQPPYRPKIKTSSPLLAGAGFVNGAAVRAVPCEYGFTLTLQTDNSITENGKLIRVGLDSNKNPTITVNLANNFSTTGLIAGDFLAAGYEYGVIKAKKLPEAQKYCVVGPQNYGAYLQFCGEWLSSAGFMPDTITTVSVSDDGITFSVWKDAAAKYGEIVKYAREHKYQLIQAKRNQRLTTMDVPGYVLGKAGFGKGDIAGILYEYGTIKLFKPDLRILGF